MLIIRFNMQFIIEISEEAIARLQKGKRVVGAIDLDEGTSLLTFKAFNERRKRKKDDRLIIQLEHGWLKESPQRIKFFNSVRKDIGKRLVDVVIHRELKTAMTAMAAEEIINCKYGL